MGLFTRKKVVKQIDDGVWGHLVSVHGMNVDVLMNKMRCVETEGFIDNKVPVTFVRVFDPSEVEQKGVVITGWDTFNDHPDLVIFEGYLTRRNEARLERKRQ